MVPVECAGPATNWVYHISEPTRNAILPRDYFNNEENAKSFILKFEDSITLYTEYRKLK